MKKSEGQDQGLSKLRDKISHLVIQKTNELSHFVNCPILWSAKTGEPSFSEEN